jgi:sugar phosphate isomerase/epimerase
LPGILDSRVGLAVGTKPNILEVTRRILKSSKPGVKRLARGDSKMKIGWCAELREAARLHRLGFDFVELPLAAFGLDSRASIDNAKAAVAAAPLPTAAFNNFFPPDLRLVGQEVDTDRVRTYLAGAAELLHHAQANVAVLGSARSRNVPDGFDRMKAEDQFLRALSWCADAMKGTGTALVIEPLNRRESNLINSVSEGVRFAERINRPEIRVLADFYHMDEENEPLETLRDCAQWLAHIHLADTGRRNPGSGSYDYDRFMGFLKEIGYAGAISSECKLENPEPEMRQSLAFLRRYWNG